MIQLKKLNYFFLMLIFCSTLPCQAGISDIAKLAQSLYDFEVSNLEFFQKIDPQNSIQGRYKESFYQHTEELKQLAKNINSLIQNPEFSRNKLLTALFKIRFKFLAGIIKTFQEHEILKQKDYQKSKKISHFKRNQKQQAIEQGFNLMDDSYSKTVFVPTDPKEIEQLKKCSPIFNPTTPIGQWNLALSKQKTDRFQIFHQMILEIMKDLPQEKLTDENILWIRCSLSLHPLFRGETDDLGHPDTACFSSFHEKETENLGLDDYGLCSFYIIQSVYAQIPDKMLGAKSNRSVIQVPFTDDELITYFPHEIPEELSQKPDLPEISTILKPKPSSSNCLPSDLKIESDASDAESTEESFLEMSNSSDSTSKDLEEMGTAPTTIENTSIEISNQIFQDFTRSTIINPISIPFAQNENPLKNKLSTPSTINSSNRYPSLDQIKNQQPQKVKIDSKNRNILPAYDLTRLHRQDEIWLQELFSNTVKVIKYRDFERVWIRLNGENSILPNHGGGSHRKLINQQHTYVGSIFTHGQHQEYGIQYIKYLRDNFLQLIKKSHLRKLGIDL